MCVLILEPRSEVQAMLKHIWSKNSWIFSTRRRPTTHHRPRFERLEDRLTPNYGLVADINPGEPNSSPLFLGGFAGNLVFSADDGVHGVEMWKSNGTTAGTVLLKDITPGSGSASPLNAVEVNGTLFFTANDGVTGTELWKTDGTPAGTVLVKDIRAGATGSTPSNLTNVSGVLFFTANDGVSGSELWKSDGTAAGTTIVRDINSGAGNSNPFAFCNVNGTLFFSATVSAVGTELWKSDGTDAGTVLVADIRPGTIGSSPTVLTNINGTLYFSADEGIHGSELWKSNGTAAGTVLVSDIYPGFAPSLPYDLVNLNGTLLFTAMDGVHGPEVWKSDGTPTGTVLVKDISPGSTSSYPRNLINVNGTVYFAAADINLGSGLWITDGTAAGTTLVMGFLPPMQTSPVFNLTNDNGTIWFTVGAGTSLGVWKTDGTTHGTVRLAARNNSSLAAVNGAIFFTSDDGVSGRELWRIVDEGVATSTALTASPMATTGGSLVLLTATVAPSPGSAGTIKFLDQNIPIAGGTDVPLVGGVAQFSTYFVTPGPHPITALYSGAAGFAPSTSNVQSVSIVAPVKILGVTPNGLIPSLASPQASRIVNVMVTFNQPVQLDDGALALALHMNDVVFKGQNQPDGFGVLPTSLQITTTDNFRWTVSWTGNTDDGLDGYRSLKDGVYDFNVDGAKVHPLGVPSFTLAGASTTVFHRLFGDTDAPDTPTGGTPGTDFQATVNSADNLVLREAFNRIATYKTYLDFDGSGVINTGDNFEFRGRFNSVLNWRV
jgi:ELWxxDGT repeat protein